MFIFPFDVIKLTEQRNHWYRDNTGVRCEPPNYMWQISP